MAVCSVLGLHEQEQHAIFMLGRHRSLRSRGKRKSGNDPAGTMSSFAKHCSKRLSERATLHAVLHAMAARMQQQLATPQPIGVISPEDEYRTWREVIQEETLACAVCCSASCVCDETRLPLRLWDREKDSRR